jgi:hypothetical protein
MGMAIDDDDSLAGVQPRDCAACGKAIPLARLAYIPNTLYCVGCVDTHGPKVVHDPNEICAKASQSCQNGFAPKD